MIEIEEGCDNVYADLQTPDAEAMYVKAHLTSKIGDLIRHRHLTQQATEILGIPQPQATILNSVALAIGRICLFSRFISTKP